LQCEPCSAPCVTCHSRDYCLSCQQHLMLYQQSCVSSCPNTTYLLTQNSTCVSCSFPCLSCTGPSVCSSCLAGYLYYRGNDSSACLEGPLCPNNLYLDQRLMECVVLPLCPANFFREPINRTCSKTCALPYIGFPPNLTCLIQCPAGYFLAVNNLCQVITNQTNFPKASLSYYILKSLLYLKLSFSDPV